MMHAPSNLFTLLMSICLLLPTAYAGGAGSPDQGGTKVVYHIDDTARAIPAIRNITNHLKAAPDTKIVVIALGHGIDFMLEGAKDDRGNPFEPMIDDLSFSGVSFRICRNTLEGRQIDADQVHPEVRPVQSGVAEIARLQQAEDYAYIKP